MDEKWCFRLLCTYKPTPRSHLFYFVFYIRLIYESIRLSSLLRYKSFIIHRICWMRGNKNTLENKNNNINNECRTLYGKYTTNCKENLLHTISLNVILTIPKNVQHIIPTSGLHILPLKGLKHYFICFRSCYIYDLYASVYI